MVDVQQELLKLGSQVAKVLHTQRAILYTRADMETTVENPITSQEWIPYGTIPCRLVWKGKTKGIQNREIFAEDNVVAVLYINSTKQDFVHAGDYVEVYQPLSSGQQKVGEFLIKSAGLQYTSHVAIPLERYQRFA